MTALCKESGDVTNMATWGTGVHKFLDKYVVGHEAVQKWLINKAAGGVANTPRFDFVVADEKFEGSVPWQKPMPAGVKA